MKGNWGLESLGLLCYQDTTNWTVWTVELQEPEKKAKHYWGVLFVNTFLMDVFSFLQSTLVQCVPWATDNDTGHVPAKKAGCYVVIAYQSY